MSHAEHQPAANPPLLATGIPPDQFYSGTKPKKNRYKTPSTKSASPPQLQDTPVHRRLASTYPYSSLGGQYVEKAFISAEAELKGKYVRVSPKRFLDTHLPRTAERMPHVQYPPFKEVAKKTIESDMYEPLIAALTPFLKDGWTLSNTSNSVDPDSAFFMDHKIKPDTSVYSSYRPPSNTNKCRACDMEAFMEFKRWRHRDDPFSDSDSNLVRDNAEARDTRGQIITYFNAMQAAQYRTHGFGILILQNMCRLMRHTHSAIEFTRAFDYTETPYLQTFFWRFSRASPDKRGIDTTFKRLKPMEAPEARRALRAGNGPLWKVCVGAESLYVAAPFTRSHHYPVGRGTRCFVAINCRTNRKCLLKDVWRVVGYHREGAVYERLSAKQVHNIPNIVAHGDVGDHRCGVWENRWRINAGSTIRKHVHYRIVLDVVGAPLTKFESTHALVKYVYNALEAHYEAYTQACVQHLDISVGNIIIVKKGDGSSAGFLIDWELARYKEDAHHRAYERTGTWQFMAARLCVAETPPRRTLGDDLESFFLLLLWMSCRYAPNGMTPRQRAAFLDSFDGVYGGAKATMLINGTHTAATLNLSSPYFDLLLAKLLASYMWRYRKLSRYDLDDDPHALDKLKKKQDQLEDHEWLMNTIWQAIDDEKWKTATKDSAQVNEVDEIVKTEDSKKRKSKCSEYGNIPKRRKGDEGRYYTVDNNNEDGEYEDDEYEDDEYEDDEYKEYEQSEDVGKEEGVEGDGECDEEDGGAVTNPAGDAWDVADFEDEDERPGDEYMNYDDDVDG